MLRPPKSKIVSMATRRSSFSLTRRLSDQWSVCVFLQKRKDVAANAVDLFNVNRYFTFCNNTKMTRTCFLSLLLLFVVPAPCSAFDWGDFHKFAVVFGTILGFGLGFGAIVLIAYAACMRPFFSSFQEEVGYF